MCHVLSKAVRCDGLGALGHVIRSMVFSYVLCTMGYAWAMRYAKFVNMLCNVVANLAMYIYRSIKHESVVKKKGTYMQQN